MKSKFDYLERNHRIERFLKDNPNANDEQIEAFAVFLKAALYSRTTYIGDVKHAIRTQLQFLRDKG